MISKEPDCLRKWDCRSKLSLGRKSDLCRKCAQTKRRYELDLIKHQELLGKEFENAPSCLNKNDCKSKLYGESLLCAKCAAIARSSSPTFRLNCSIAQKRRRDRERHLSIGTVVLQKCNPL